MRKLQVTVAMVALNCTLFTVSAQDLVVQVNKPVAAVQPTMWGIFFEDINFGADGGLYAELVKNRSFEFLKPMLGWKELRQTGKGKTLIINQGNEKPQNPRFARITVDSGSYGLSNEGFRGMGIQKGKQYNFSVWAKSGEGNLIMKVELVNTAGKKIGEASLTSFSNDWKKYTVSFITTDTASKGLLNVFFEGKGMIDVDMISLFPQDTWKNRPNGLRADLVQMLADLKPGFIRFPGGCIVEGQELETRYQWKKTVGLPEDRQLSINRWNTEFPRRSTPDYFQSFGLGFYEYFQLSEDIGAEPLPILNCGMACQYNTGEVAPMDQLDPYIQDALDLIEFANGDTSTKWGKLRADMGHPATFNLKYLGIGNEQWDEQYVERYRAFEKVLQQKHPGIVLVGSAGPAPNGPRFDYAWKEFKQSKAGLVDEHYYQSPEWFFKNATRYDNYDRKGPKVFAGEYAAHSKDDKDAESKNTWISALAEAAFMTGLERNADIVQMASYAPLFAHVEAWQWRPDLIWFDNLRSVGTPNYYVQKLFANNKGTLAVPILQYGHVLTGKDSIYASATIDQNKKILQLKIVNASSAAKGFMITIEGASVFRGGVWQVLSATDPLAYNTLDKPSYVVPISTPVKASGSRLKVLLQPSSFNVLSLPFNKKSN
ncbi:carbohydrate binding domain-containing protein [Chitinophagaceae bacterium LB-8]|uniref:non-reducing end alpha-L-arabinofuranosidase n=1 Tax=Paraflavisolibacter caeni TaxID=2982496 RepID=A0A9X2XWI6_9BACT|nr:alpha-L-arabinofuranosidase C-terminal domain-containing protein [Paraflavisolibacter caeni]MCU7550210.1 carbohydrate binding domain-containing protein [Paraflavisolibacter caeni]